MYLYFLYTNPKLDTFFPDWENNRELEKLTRRQRQRKRHLELEFALFQTSSLQFYLVQIVKCGWFFWRKVWRKFQVIVVQGRQRNVQQKSAVMPVQSCCFANLNLLLFCPSRCPRRRHGCLSSLIIRWGSKHQRIQVNITEYAQVLTSLPVPHANGMTASNFFLQLQDTIEQSLSSRRTAWYIDIHWNDPVTATNYWIGVVIVATTICTAEFRTEDKLKLLQPVPFDFLHQTKSMAPLLGLH